MAQFFVSKENSDPKKPQNDAPVFRFESEIEAAVDQEIESQRASQSDEDEFANVPKVTEEEAAREVAERISELREFLRSQG